MSTEFRVGDIVWDGKGRRGVVQSVELGDTYPVRVRFGGRPETYTLEGEFNVNNPRNWMNISKTKPSTFMDKVARIFARSI